jgi:AraC-like DNA-binding protein
MDEYALDPVAALLEAFRRYGSCVIQRRIMLPPAVELPLQEVGGRFLLAISGGCRLERPANDPVMIAEGDLLFALTGAGGRIVPEPNASGELLLGTLQAEEFRELPLEHLLPDWLHLRRDTASASVLGVMLDCVHRESRIGEEGSYAIVQGLITTICLEAVRTQLRTVDLSAAGWVRGLEDHELGPILARMLTEPQRPWTVASLAAAGRMARSSFARRFRAEMGVAPMALLTDIRMRKARALLRQSHLGLKEIARQVGYRTAGAFSTAFRRDQRMTPMEFRTRQPPSTTRDAAAAASGLNVETHQAGHELIGPVLSLTGRGLGRVQPLGPFREQIE